MKDLHAELITYLAEDPYFINEALSYELWGQAVFQYWKVHKFLHCYIAWLITLV